VLGFRLRREHEEITAPLDTADHADLAAVLETVAAALYSGVVLLDGYEVILANDAAAALRVVQGTTLSFLPLVKLVQQARRSGERIETDLELTWGAGWRPISVTVAPVPHTERVVLLLRDLTESRRLEAVRRDFVASVSHELKTPVGGLLLLAEALRDGVDDPAAARRFADRMVHEADRLSGLVRDLLDLSRLQGGEPLPEPSAVDVVQLITEGVDRVHVTADAAGIALVVGDSAGLEVWGDRRSLLTAVVNLLDNALTYSAPGTRVAVGARAVRNEGSDQVEIAVADQGIGIGLEDLDRVFERFYRADPARSRSTGGTGLGLAIVKHVADNCGGRVSVWSQPGMGSTFTLHLPVPPAPTRTASVTTAARTEPA